MNDVQCVQKIVELQILCKVTGLYWNLKGLYSPRNLFKLLSIEINRVPFAIQNLAIPYNFVKSFALCIFIHVQCWTFKVRIDILESRNSSRHKVDFFTVLNLSNEACPFIIPLRSFSLTLLKLTALCQKIENVQTNDDCAKLRKPDII